MKKKIAILGSTSSIGKSLLNIIKKEKKNLIPAVTHIDGTGRLQTVNSHQNKKFYNF